MLKSFSQEVLAVNFFCGNEDIGDKEVDSTVCQVCPDI